MSTSHVFLGLVSISAWKPHWNFELNRSQRETSNDLPFKTSHSLICPCSMKDSITSSFVHSFLHSLNEIYRWLLRVSCHVSFQDATVEKQTWFSLSREKQILNWCNKSRTLCVTQRECMNIKKEYPFTYEYIFIYKYIDYMNIFMEEIYFELHYQTNWTTCIHSHVNHRIHKI